MNPVDCCSSRGQLILLLLLLSLVTCCALSPECTRVREVSYILDENTLHWPSARSLVINKTQDDQKNQTQDGRNITFYYSSEDLAFNSHTGTHLDAPCHFVQSTWCVTDIPVDLLFNRPLVVFRSKNSHTTEWESAGYLLTLTEFLEFERNTEIPEGSVIFFQTGWSSRWPIRDSYFGIRSGNSEDLNFPGLERSLADYLLASGKFVGVGIEGPSLDPGFSKDMYAHRKLFSQNIYGIENLPNLSEVPETGARVTIAPLRVSHGSGAPTRIFVSQRTRYACNSAQDVALSRPVFLLLLLSLIALSLSHHCSRGGGRRSSGTQSA